MPEVEPEDELNPMPTTGPAYFKVFGLQRSGTNLMRALLAENFHVEYLQEQDTGWKHGPLRIPQGIWKGQPVRFALCVKNPYAWAVSCYRFFRKYAGADPTIAPQFQADPSMSFEEFLLTRNYGFETPIHRWNQMHRMWLATLPADRTLVVRQEDQLVDQQTVLRRAAAALSLKPRHDSIRGIEQRVDMDLSIHGSMNRDYYLDHKYMEEYTPCLLDRVNGLLDRPLMEEFGYDLERWTIQARQIGPLRLFVRPCTSDAANAFQIAADPHRIGQIKQQGHVVHTIVDFGAHIGAWSLFARGLWPESRMRAYEPGSDLFRLLRLNTRELQKVKVTGGHPQDPADSRSHPMLLVQARLIRILEDSGEVSLLRIGCPDMARGVLQDAALISRLASKVDWVCASLPAPGFSTPLSATHNIQTWSTPSGNFLFAGRRRA